MGLLNWLGLGVAPNTAALPTNLTSPYGDPNNLSPAVIFAEEFGVAASAIVTEEMALRVPEINRALQAHTALVAPLKFEVYRDGERLEEQPFWVTNSASGISPYIRWVGVVRDLFFHGAAVLGCELDAFGLVHDVIHIPDKHWQVNSQTGLVEADPDVIPANYRQRLIYVPLGANGLLADAADSIRQARKLELARQKRLDTPPPSTNLQLTDPKYDEMTREEKAALSKSYSENRALYTTAVTPSYMKVEDKNNQTVDLFEAGMNSLRIQLAMHGGVPASFLEAGKEGGGNGQMTYTNENGKASELWVFGSARFAYAITAALSMDPVVGANAEVRADLSDFMVPTPDQLSAESPVTDDSEPVEAPEPPAITE